MTTGTHPIGSGSRQWADRLGIWTSSLCVVHCVLTPALLSFSAVAAHFLPGEERTHRSLAMLVALFGTFSIVVGFRSHRRVAVIALLFGGLGCLAGTAWFGDALPSHAYEIGITFCGSAMMIGAHRLNHTFCRSCECAAHCDSKHAGPAEIRHSEAME